MATATETSLENKHLGNGDYYLCDYCFFLISFIVDRAGCKWTSIRRAIEVNVESERFTVVCSHCR